jgi:hypothetical protein
MRGRATRIVGLLAAAAMSAGGGTAALAATAQAAPRANPDVTKLFGRALATVHATRRPLFARAQVYEVDGITADGRSARSASAITRWRFVFDNFPSKSRFDSATLTWTRGAGFGRVIGITSPFLEDLVIPRAPKMTLAKAVIRLRRAGITTPFKAVTLRRPVGPHDRSTQYFFGLSNGRYVSVDTRTGRVRWQGG